MKRKKLRLKKIWIFLLLLFLVGSIYIYLKPEKKIQPDATADFVSQIIFYEHQDFERDFLTWIEKEYSAELLEKLYKNQPSFI